MKSLRADGRLEDFARRWGVPHVPEFEMGLFRRLFGAELRAALASLAKAKTAEELSLRGRVRRLLGDPLAFEDFRRSLDLKPGAARELRRIVLVGPPALPPREMLCWSSRSSSSGTSRSFSSAC